MTRGAPPGSPAATLDDQGAALELHVVDTAGVGEPYFPCANTPLSRTGPGRRLRLSGEYGKGAGVDS